MSRDLRLLSVLVRRDQRGKPAFVGLNVLSADLKSQPVHVVELDPMRALELAEGLLHAARIVMGEADR